MLNKPKKRIYSIHHNIIKPQTFKLKSINKFFKYALISLENGVITAAQLSAATLAIKRKIKQHNILLIKIFPHLPVTKRPAEMPLGRGKTNVDYWATPIKTGTIIFEINYNQPILIKTALIAASYKFPIKTQIIR